MSTILRMIAETKFLFAKNFYKKISSMTKIKADKNDMVYEFLKLTRRPEELSAFILFDANPNFKRLYAMLESFCRSQKKINDKMLTSISNALLTSYPSLLRIENISDDKILAYDKVLKKSLSIEKTDLSIKDEYIFARVLEVDGFFYILDVLDYLEERLVDSFLKKSSELILANLNTHSLKSVKIEQKICALKQELPSIYILLDTIGENKNHDSLMPYKANDFDLQVLFNQDDLILFKEFLLFTQKKFDFYDRECIFLFNIVYKSILKEKGENFSSIENFSFEDIFMNLASKGFFLCDSDLNKVILIFSEFYKYMAKRKEVFSKSLLEFKNISRKVFIYKNLLKKSSQGFYFDENLLELFYDFIEFDLLKKFSVFLDMVNSSNLIISKGKKTLTPSSLQKLAYIMKLKPFKDLNSPKQVHYPLIDFFLNFCFEKGLLRINDGYLVFEEKLLDFLSISPPEQLAIFIGSAFNRNFILTYLDESRYSDLTKILNLVKIAINSKTNIDIKVMDKIIKDRCILKLLEDFELIRIYKHTVAISPYGRKILPYYTKNDNKNIINFNLYKK